MGPVKQYTGETVEGPLTLLRSIPAPTAASTLYEDDGVSFGYRKGDWMGITATWDDRRRQSHLASRERVAHAATSGAKTRSTPDAGRGHAIARFHGKSDRSSVVNIYLPDHVKDFHVVGSQPRVFRPGRQ